MIVRGREELGLQVVGDREIQHHVDRMLAALRGADFTQRQVPYFLRSLCRVSSTTIVARSLLAWRGTCSH